MNDVLSLLGLIYRANKLILGENCLNNINKIKFLFISSDASIKSQERYLKKCNYYHIPYTLKYSTYELSKSIGKDNVKILGVVDSGFTKIILNKIGEEIDG